MNIPDFIEARLREYSGSPSPEMLRLLSALEKIAQGHRQAPNDQDDCAYDNGCGRVRRSGVSHALGRAIRISTPSGTLTTSSALTTMCSRLPERCGASRRPRPGCSAQTTASTAPGRPTSSVSAAHKRY